MLWRNSSALFGALLTLSLYWPATGLAQNDDERDIELAGEAVLEARKLLKNERYFEGMAAYEMAYRLFPDPNYLFAIARIEARLPGDRCETRLKAWKRFLNACTDCSKLGEGKRAFADTKYACETKLAAAPRLPENAQDKTLNEILLKAERHYREGQYAAGAAAYEVLYSMQAKPSHIFMKATGLSKLQDRCSDALNAWAQYLSICDSTSCTFTQIALSEQAKIAARCRRNTGKVALITRQSSTAHSEREFTAAENDLALGAMVQLGSGVTLNSDIKDAKGIARQGTILELGTFIGHRAIANHSKFEQSVILGLERPLVAFRFGWLYDDGWLFRLGIQPHLEPAAFAAYASAGYNFTLSDALSMRTELNFVFFPGHFDAIKPVGLSLGGAYVF